MDSNPDPDLEAQMGNEPPLKRNSTLKRNWVFRSPFSLRRFSSAPRKNGCAAPRRSILVLLSILVGATLISAALWQWGMVEPHSQPMKESMTRRRLTSRADLIKELDIHYGEIEVNIVGKFVGIIAKGESANEDEKSQCDFMFIENENWVDDMFDRDGYYTKEELREKISTFKKNSSVLPKPERKRRRFEHDEPLKKQWKHYSDISGLVSHYDLGETMVTHMCSAVKVLPKVPIAAILLCEKGDESGKFAKVAHKLPRIGDCQHERFGFTQKTCIDDNDLTATVLEDGNVQLKCIYDRHRPNNTWSEWNITVPKQNLLDPVYVPKEIHMQRIIHTFGSSINSRGYKKFTKSFIQYHNRFRFYYSGETLHPQQINATVFEFFVSGHTIANDEKARKRLCQLVKESLKEFGYIDCCFKESGEYDFRSPYHVSLTLVVYTRNDPFNAEKVRPLQTELTQLQTEERQLRRNRLQTAIEAVDSLTALISLLGFSEVKKNLLKLFEDDGLENEQDIGWLSDTDISEISESDELQNAMKDLRRFINASGTEKVHQLQTRMAHLPSVERIEEVQVELRRLQQINEELLASIATLVKSCYPPSVDADSRPVGVFTPARVAHRYARRGHGNEPSF